MQPSIVIGQSHYAGFNFRSILKKEDNIALHTHYGNASLASNLHEFCKYNITRAGYAIYQNIIPEHEPGNTLIIATSGGILGSLLAHEKLNIPLITMYLSPFSIRSYKNPPRLSSFHFSKYLPKTIRHISYRMLEHFFINHIAGNVFNQLRKQLDLNSIQSLHDYHYQHTNLVLSCVPKWFANRTDQIPNKLKYIGFPLSDKKSKLPIPEKLASFLDDKGGPIVFTFGTEIRGLKKIFTESIKICRRLNRKGLFLSRHITNIPDPLPSFICHLKYFPLESILDKCAAIVHHAGIGTIAQGMRAGIPQVSVPSYMDQFDNSYCLMKLGIATEIKKNKYNAKDVSKKLSNLLASPEVHQQLRVVKKMLSHSTNLDNIYQEISNITKQEILTNTSS